MSETKEIQQQEPEKPNQSYISRVRLKGYKSIIDTEVTFKPGLNIIIGANGSGKTNFVEFLDLFLNAKFDKANNLEIESNGYIRGNYYEYFFQKSYKIPIHIEQPKSFKEATLTYTINGKEELPKLLGFLDDYYLKIQIETLRREQKFFNSSIFIRFNTPEVYNKLNDIFSFSYKKGEKFDIDFPGQEISFFNLTKLILAIYLSKTSKENLPIEKEELASNFLSNAKTVIQLLKKFTPIQDVRINPNFTIAQESNKIEGKNIFLEFFINDEWLRWNNLSDGTKRMFYLVTEVGDIGLNNMVILLEEPELGIHPHQLIRLMDFIKEQSETKQIILTTHSPEVLNCLKMDELDRIIVAHYDKESGTQLSHLSEEEIEHMRSYMKNELFISDYWIFSGFEKEEESI